MLAEPVGNGGVGVGWMKEGGQAERSTRGGGGGGGPRGARRGERGEIRKGEI